MSNPLKAVGKVFKKVVKVVKKIAIPLLIVGAVVLTGGAALGALPAMGAMLGSIGITGTMASVLGSAISMGAVGAVTGGLASVAGGGKFMAGATKGFLVGAATGGLLGGVGAVGANGVFGGIGGASATSAASTATTGVLGPTTGVGQGLLNATAPVFTAAPGVAIPTLSTGIGAAGAGAGALTSSIGTAATVGTGTASGGLLSTMGPELLKAGGQIVSGFASGKAAAQGTKAQIKAQQEADRLEADRVAFNYGYRNIYDKDKKGRTINGVPTSQSKWYDYAPQDFAQPNAGLLQSAFAGRPAVPTYQIINGQVVAG